MIPRKLFQRIRSLLEFSPKQIGKTRFVKCKECVWGVLTTSSRKGCSYGLTLLNNFPGILSQTGWVGEGPGEGHGASQLLTKPQNQADPAEGRWNPARWQQNWVEWNTVCTHTYMHTERMGLIPWRKGEDLSGKALVNHSFGQAEWSKEVWPGRRLACCAAGQKRCRQLINF